MKSELRSIPHSFYLSLVNAVWFQPFQPKFRFDSILISGMEREIKLIKLQLNLAGIELEFKRGKQSFSFICGFIFWFHFGFWFNSNSRHWIELIKFPEIKMNQPQWMEWRNWLAGWIKLNEMRLPIDWIQISWLPINQLN